jgi:hypothetical protein
MLLNIMHINNRQRGFQFLFPTNKLKVSFGIQLVSNFSPYRNWVERGNRTQSDRALNTNF